MQNRRSYLLIVFFIFHITAFSQTKKDSVILPEVTVSAYLEQRPVLSLPASVVVIDSSQLNKQSGQSLVPVLNAAPGVRMEERSPGSYRLSVRGSLIRSPFGVRNTKIYLDEFPLTNAGGEAYLNLIDVNSISNIEVLKGPDGSLFGANSGGVLRISPTNLKDKRSHANIGMSAGSYAMFRQNIGAQEHFGKSTITFNASWQRADGYRENSSMDRRYFQFAHRVNYSEKGQLRFLFLYADHAYQTPGGLTLSQFKEDPKQARPATKFLPGASEQNAGIRNRTLYGGILNDVYITKRIKYVAAIFGSHTFFENPFITNYEVREESNGGARTWFEFTNKAESGIDLKLNVGAEGQAMQSRISNYGNYLGSMDTVQAIDDVTISQGFAFTRLVANFYNKLLIEGSVSYNYNQFMFTRKQPNHSPTNKKVFEPQFMPRLAASYLVNDHFTLRAIVSRGYSPPTLQEIRSSDNTVNTMLQAENGWNYETGLRLYSNNKRFWWDASVYYYQLENAIVQRSNSAGQAYFVNTGGTQQPGFETQISFDLVKKNTAFVRNLNLTNAYSYQPYIFNNYSNENINLSGKNLTGVPQHIIVTGISSDLPLNFYTFIQHNYTSRITLNDVNSEYANAYHLVQIKAGWKYFASPQFVFDISAGVDNLLDEKYSLGNDLNAFGGRYYNAAPPRNYFIKINVWF